MLCYLANRWEGYAPSGYTGCPGCAVSIHFPSWLQCWQPQRHSSLCQGHRDTYGVPRGSVHTGSVTRCKLKTSGQEQPAGAGISDIPTALGGNQSTSSTLGTKMLQALFMSVHSLPSSGRAAAAKEKGLHILCCSLTHFFLLRPYPSYSGSKMAVKKCWQLGDLLLKGCSVS